jgi:hypothetical protein
MKNQAKKLCKVGFTPPISDCFGPASTCSAEAIGAIPALQITHGLEARATVSPALLILT